MGGPHAVLMGAVAYDPKVVTIWDGFRRFFARHDLDFDYVLGRNFSKLPANQKLFLQEAAAVLGVSLREGPSGC